MAIARFPVTQEDVRSLAQLLSSEKDQVALAHCALALGAAAAKLDAGHPSRDMVFRSLKAYPEGWKDANARAHAALGIGHCASPGAGEHLLGIFDSGEHPDVLAAAAIGLGMLKHAPAVPSLCGEVVKPRSGGDARGMSMLALGMIGDEAGLAFLRDVIAWISIPYVRWWAVIGLGTACDEKSYPTLAGLAADRNRIVRDAGLRAVARYRDDRAAAVLMQRFRAEENAEIRALILHLVGECASEHEMPLAALAEAFSPETMFSMGETGMMLYLRG
jgi:HEAT repeat protein